MSETTDNAAPAADAAEAAIPDIFSKSGESLEDVAAEAPKGDPTQEPAPDHAEGQEATTEPNWQAEATTLKAQFEDLQKQLHAAKSDAGRIAAYQKQIDELKAQVNAVPKPEPETPAILADYPEAQALIAAEVERRLAERDAAAQKQQEQAQQANNALTRSLDLAVPDWREQWQSKEFQDWFAKQKPEVQAYAGSAEKSPDVGEAIALFNHYARDRIKAAPTPEPKQDESLAAAASTTKGSATQPGETPVIDNDDWGAVDNPNSRWYSPRPEDLRR